MKTKAPAVENVASSYVTTFQSEHFHKSMRYHWVVCRAQNPDEMVSWGYAPTQQEAELAARKEVNDLCLGLTEGGRATNTVTPFTKRCPQFR